VNDVLRDKRARLHRHVITDSSDVLDVRFSAQGGNKMSEQVSRSRLVEIVRRHRDRWLGRGPKTAIAFCALLLGGLLTACGATKSHAASPTSVAAASATASASGGTTTGSPVLIGFANNEGQGISVPEYRYGAEAAVKYMNGNGGINGHPIRLDECINDGSPEGSVNCANKFVAAHTVAYYAGVDLGADSALPILDGAGMPYFTEFAWGPKTLTDGNSFLFGAGLLPFYISPVQELKALGIKKTAYFYYNVPTALAYLDTAKNTATAEGITTVPIQISATNPDWTSAVATAEADHVDAMWAILQEGDCTNMVRSARSAGFTGPLGVGSCSSYITALGSEAGNTVSDFPFYFPSVAAEAPPSYQDQIKTYQAAMAADGHASSEEGYAVSSFATTIELGEVMKGISGPITAASVKAALQQAKIPGFMGPNINCPTRTIASEPAVCSDAILQYKVVASGSGAKKTLLTPNFVNTVGVG
jgi:branched-chain amino acid transport system substrate-binding protein